MSNIASLVTGGPSVSAQGSRGKASANSQDDGNAFAKQLSENKTSKDSSSSNSKTDSIQIEKNGTEVDVELSNSTSKFVDKITFDFDLKSDANPVKLNVELHINELEPNSDLNVDNMTDSLIDIPAEELTLSPEELSLNDETPVSAADVEISTTDQGILAALNSQLSGKMKAVENVQIIKPPLDNTTTENDTASVNQLVNQMDAALKTENSDIVDPNKVITKNAGVGALSASVQNIDASKVNNAQNADAAKLPSNASILTNLANGEGLSDKGADHQKDGGSNQFANHVDRAGIKIEGVDVLEARVFPAISPSNGTNIADALLKTRQVGGSSALQNNDSIYNISQPKMMNTLKIQLVPANLGVVTAVMKLTGEELQVHLQVDNVEAYRKLSADSASIVNTLKNQGFGIEQVNVQLMNGDRGSAQQGQQNGQSFQGQTQQEASSSFDRERRDANSNELNQELGNNESDVPLAPQVTDLSNGVYL